jgi:hypothetical protein
MPLAEMAYNHYMENGIPIPGLPQQFNTPGALYAVKPKGGNNPMNLGSTLPLEQQGEMGKYLSKAQITDPMKVFEERLKNHFDDDRDQNYKLQKAYEERLQHRMEEQPHQGYHLTDEQKNELKRQFAEEFTQAVEHARLNAGDPDGKKLYSPSEIETAAKNYNEWTQGPLKNYITKQMGTGLETDSLLKVMNELNVSPHDIFDRMREPNAEHKKFIIESAAERREKFAEEYSGGFPWNRTPELEEMVKNSSIGKQTATTPMGKYYEDLIDKSFYPGGRYNFPKEDYPGTSFLKDYDVINDFLSGPDEYLGFKQMQNRIFDDLLEGKIKDLSKLPNRTPSNIMQDIIKEKVAEMKAMQKNKELYHGWRQENHNALPSDVTFTDAEGNPTNTKLIIFDSKLANANEDLVTRNLAQDTKDLDICSGACRSGHKWIPMVEPHTGVANSGDSSMGKSYLGKIQRGEISIASLRAANGESKAAFELSPIKNLGDEARRRVISLNGEPKVEVSYGWFNPNKKDYFDSMEAADNHINALKTAPQQFKIEQLKGKNNSKVVGDEYINDAKNWLNYKHQTGELSSLPFEDIKNLPGVYDFSNIESYRNLALSQEPKAHLANKLFDEAVRNKLKQNPELSQDFFRGHIPASDVLPELGRFVTADDIINKFGSK